MMATEVGHTGGKGLHLPSAECILRMVMRINKVGREDDHDGDDLIKNGPQSIAPIDSQ